MKRMETDSEIYTRVAEKYGKWGAFLGHALGCRGSAMDDCAAHLGLVRGMTDAYVPSVGDRVRIIGTAFGAGKGVGIFHTFPDAWWVLVDGQLNPITVEQSRLAPVLP